MNTPADKIVTDVKVLGSDVEELLKTGAARSGEQFAAARDRVQSALGSAKEAAITRGRDAAQSAEQYAKANPWTAVGVAAGIGVLVGLLIGRR